MEAKIKSQLRSYLANRKRTLDRSELAEPQTKKQPLASSSRISNSSHSYTSPFMDLAEVITNKLIKVTHRLFSLNHLTRIRLESGCKIEPVNTRGGPLDVFKITGNTRRGIAKAEEIIRKICRSRGVDISVSKVDVASDVDSSGVQYNSYGRTSSDSVSPLYYSPLPRRVIPFTDYGWNDLFRACQDTRTSDDGTSTVSSVDMRSTSSRSSNDFYSRVLPRRPTIRTASDNITKIKINGVPIDLTIDSGADETISIKKFGSRTTIKLEGAQDVDFSMKILPAGSSTSILLHRKTTH